jgi:hypothetical protein
MSTTNEMILSAAEVEIEVAGKDARPKISVVACPDLPSVPPGGGLVTGTFTTERASTVSICFADKQTIGTTASHKFYSVDRGDWVRASDLRPGEQVQTNTGITVVARVHPRAERAPVYNVEVSRYHTYFLGEAGVCAQTRASPRTVRVAIRSHG